MHMHATYALLAGPVLGSVSEVHRAYGDERIQGGLPRTSYGVARIVNERGGVDSGVPVYVSPDERRGISLTRADQMPIGGSDLDLQKGYDALGPKSQFLVRRCNAHVINHAELLFAIAEQYPVWACSLEAAGEAHTSPAH